jgi:hypothetical protein
MSAGTESPPKVVEPGAECPGHHIGTDPGLLGTANDIDVLPNLG